jgi:hypothetical protein
MTLRGSLEKPIQLLLMIGYAAYIVCGVALVAVRAPRVGARGRARRGRARRGARGGARAESGEGKARGTVPQGADWRAGAAQAGSYYLYQGTGTGNSSMGVGTILMGVGMIAVGAFAIFANKQRCAGAAGGGGGTCRSRGPGV